MGKDYYKILGVEKTNTADEIKKAFRKKAHEFHPDKTDGDEAKFKEINEAYQVLGNPERKQQYDQFGTSFEGFGGQAAYDAGFDWADIMRQGGGQRTAGVNFDFGDLGDIFGDLFNGGQRNSTRSYSRVQRGHDIEVNLTVDFNDAVFGLEKTLDITKMVICNYCKGNGAEPGTTIETCEKCGGQGQINTTQQTFFGAFRSAVTCPECGGEGKKASKLCTKCQGHGRKQDKERIKIQVPAGINTGETMRLTGKGEAGEKGGEAGDLYINIQVKPSSEFIRDGYNVYTTQKIKYSQAVIGDKIKVKTVDGEVNLKIPTGTPTGKQFILKDKGITKLRGRGRGDQIVTVEVDVPKDLNKKQKKLLKELDEVGL